MANRPRDNVHIELFTISEVAGALRVCERTVWRMIERGEIQHCKVRNRTFVASEDLRRYLRQH